MMNAKIRTVQTVSGIFDLEDKFAREQDIRGPHPRPLEPINFYLVRQITNNQQHKVASPWPMIVHRNPSGYYLFNNQVLWPDGLVRCIALNEQPYTLLIKSHFYQPLKHPLRISAPETILSLSLEAGSNYPFYLINNKHN